MIDLIINLGIELAIFYLVLVFFIFRYKIKRKSVEIFENTYKKKYENYVLEYLFQDTSFHEQNNGEHLMKKVLVDVLIWALNNFKGMYKEKILQLYFELELDKSLLKKYNKSKSDISISEVIHEIYYFEIRTLENLTWKHLIDENNVIRLYSISALIAFNPEYVSIIEKKINLTELEKIHIQKITQTNLTEKANALFT